MSYQSKFTGEEIDERLSKLGELSAAAQEWIDLSRDYLFSDSENEPILINPDIAQEILDFTSTVSMFRVSGGTGTGSHTVIVNTYDNESCEMTLLGGIDSYEIQYFGIVVKKDGDNFYAIRGGTFSILNRERD